MCSCLLTWMVLWVTCHHKQSFIQHNYLFSIIIYSLIFVTILFKHCLFVFSQANVRLQYSKQQTEERALRTLLQLYYNWWQFQQLLCQIHTIICTNMFVVVTVTSLVDVIWEQWQKHFILPKCWGFGVGSWEYYNTNSLWLLSQDFRLEMWVDAPSNYNMPSQSKKGVLATGGNEYWQHPFWSTSKLSGIPITNNMGNGWIWMC